MIMSEDQLISEREISLKKAMKEESSVFQQSEAIF